jgi:cbb3-type cytochrome oxidase subunit 3
MWTDPAIQRFLLLSGTISFGLFFICYFYLVLRNRGSHWDDDRAARNRWNELGSWSMGLFALGAWGIIFSILLQQVVGSEGAWRGERPIEAIARIPPPANQSTTDRQLLEHTRTLLLAQRKSLAAKPLILPATPVQEHQAALAVAVERRATIHRFLQRLEGPKREVFDEISKKQDKIVQVRTDLAAGKKKLEQAQERWQVLHERLASKTGNFGETEELAAEITQLRQQTIASETELRHLEEALMKAQTVARGQDPDLAHDMDKLQFALLTALEEIQQRERELEREKDAASKHREHELAQFDEKIQQLTTILNDAPRSARPPAPAPGWIVFRESSSDGAMKARTSAKSFRFLAKVPHGQVESIRAAGEIALQAGEGELRRDFSGRFLRSCPIETEPSKTMVELECNPAPEVVEALMEKNKVREKYAWQPSLLSLWPFTVGIVLVLLGLLCGVLWFCFRDPNHHEVSRQSRLTSIRANAPATLRTAALPSEIAPDSGITAEIIERIALQLRESIVREKMDEETIASAEDIFASDHSRAVRIFRSVLRQDRSYVEHLEALPKSSSADQPSFYSRILFILESTGTSPQQLQVISEQPGAQIPVNRKKAS